MIKMPEQPPVPPAAKSAAEKDKHTSLDQFPDEVLLLILHFLAPSARGLLCTVRAVCRRWRRLALAPELWQRCAVRLLPAGLPDSRVAALALAVAPCVRRVEVASRVLTHLKLRTYLPRWRACGAEEMKLMVCSDNGGSSAISLLQRQLRLGRLRRLQLRVTSLCRPQTKKMVYEAIESVTQQLVELDLFVEQEMTGSRFSHTPEHNIPAVAPRAAGWSSSLKRLDVYAEESRFGLVRALRTLISSSAGSLESLRLHYEAPLELVAAVAATLESCSQLRHLRLPTKSRILETCLPRCPRITRLEVDVYAPGFHAATDLAPAFSALTQLRSLLFHRMASLLVVDWVTALASSGRSELQTLHVGFVASTNTFLYLLDLVPALRRLTQLRALSFLGQPPVGFLKVLTPENTPQLELLSFSAAGRPCSYSDDGDVCYLVEVRELMQRVEGLHVSDLAHSNEDHQRSIFCDCDCQCCQRNTPAWQLYGNISLCPCPAGQSCKMSGEKKFWLRVADML